MYLFGFLESGRWWVWYGVTWDVILFLYIIIIIIYCILIKNNKESIIISSSSLRIVMIFVNYDHNHNWIWTWEWVGEDQGEQLDLDGRRPTAEIDLFDKAQGPTWRNIQITTSLWLFQHWLWLHGPFPAPIILYISIYKLEME